MQETGMTVYYICKFKTRMFPSNISFLLQSGPLGGVTSKDIGVNCLALHDLFQMSNERNDIISYHIYVQMVEIYNEQVRDLLAEDKTNNKYSFDRVKHFHTTNKRLGRESFISSLLILIFANHLSP